jgi:hypothetical protein
MSVCELRPASVLRRRSDRDRGSAGGRFVDGFSWVTSVAPTLRLAARGVRTRKGGRR